MARRSRANDAEDARGSSCGTARSTSTPPPWVSSPPTRRGTTSSGSTSNLLAASAERMRPRLAQTPDVAANSFPRSECDRRHKGIMVHLLNRCVSVPYIRQYFQSSMVQLANWSRIPSKCFINSRQRTAPSSRSVGN